MKKLFIAVFVFLCGLINADALVQGEFIHYDDYILCHGEKYGIDILNYEGKNYYFLSQPGFNNYNNDVDDYSYVDDYVETNYDTLKYRFIADEEFPSDQVLFFYRYWWKTKFPGDEYSFASNDEEKEARYQNFKNKMDLIINPNFEDYTIYVNEVGNLEYDYLKYFEVTHDDGLYLSQKSNELSFSAVNPGTYHIYLTISHDSGEEKVVSDGEYQLGSDSTLEKTHIIKVEVLEDELSINPPDTLDIKGILVILSLLGIIVIYVIQKH